MKWALPALALTGCVSIPAPTPLDVARAAQKGRSITLEALDAGRSSYLARCGSCHQLYAPSAQPPSAWPGVVEDMQARAKLDAAQRAEITDYLVTLAEAP